MLQPGDAILCLNSGSSSLKFALYQLNNEQEQLLAEGTLDGIGPERGSLHIIDSHGQMLTTKTQESSDHQSAVQSVLDVLRQLNLPQPQAVGHRLVHGGTAFTAPTIVNKNVLLKLHELIPFAPLHLPNEIRVIEAVANRLAAVPQVVCFDTAFHSTMPDIAKRLPIPHTLWNEGLRRYGFHGLSYEYILSVLKPEPQNRTIVAHLGNGASLAAVKGTRPIETTMGFTPAGGLMMGTRTGDIDPGVLLFLLRQKSYDISQLDDFVNKQSGLLGVSGMTADMKMLLEKRKTNPQADMALQLFCYRIRKYIGALTTVLEGLDTLVFTGGIGEKAAPIRSQVCHGLEFMGVHIDMNKNKSHADIISTSQSSCVVRVIPTNENLVIARHAHKLLS